MNLDREQTISIAVLVLLLLCCASAVELSFSARSHAVEEMTERRETLSRLEATSQLKRAKSMVAPPAAFLDAPTQGLAGAQLQSYVSQLAVAQQASLVSSGLEPIKREDAPDTIRLAATMELSSKGLQAMLHQLETGLPYVLVELLTVQPAGGTGGRSPEDPLLRANLGLRAFWRKGPP
jgi:general secretion pathway protein M